MEPQERHYNINKLNILFAVSSIVLLLSLVWLFADDYSRKWKEHQKEFRTLEIEKTRVKYDGTVQELAQSEEYQTLLAQLEGAKKAFAASCAKLTDTEAEIEKVRAENSLIEQDHKFTKAALDAARYRYEDAKAHEGKGLLQSRKEFDRLNRKVHELKIALEQSNDRLADKTKIVDDCGQELTELKRKERIVAKQAHILELKLAKIDPDKMNFTNRIADMVRDLPVIDLANPSNKIEQVVLKDITDDVNFMQVPKVERCITCHKGISNPDYREAPQPYTTHPKLDLFVANDSTHPLEEFGCTSCHGGRGRGTDFVSSAHTPSSSSQAKEWEEKHHWHKFHHWETPMLPMPYVEASCFKCHSGQTVIKEAEKLNLGLHLIEKTGCYNCHLIEQYKDWPKPGPDLTKLASKISKDWAYRWIQDPKSFRHDTWMPSFFGQSNSSDEESVRRTQQEIHAMIGYLFEKSGAFPIEKMPAAGDPVKGEEIVAAVGCFGCHLIRPEKSQTPRTRAGLRLEHGPNLISMGTKASEEWIYNWLKNPHRYHPETKMPNMRLSDQEAADVAAYLASLTDEDFNKVPVPGVDEKAVDEIVIGFLSKQETRQAATAKLASMSLKDKLNYSGEKLIRQYGCFSCHNIPGFEQDKPIGTEMTGEGSKPVDRLDFGFVDIEHTNYAWFTQKLKEPRIFDRGKIKPHDEKLRMPNFNFSDEEIEAIVTVLLGFVKERPAPSKMVARTSENLFKEEGQRIVRLYNCQGCHVIEGEGGAVQSSVKDWLVQYNNRTRAEADAIVTSFSPPDLIGEGQKVQARWLFGFLHQPTAIRPWLKVRMPTYAFNTAHLNALVKYFNALDDQDFPFTGMVDVDLTEEEYAAAEELFSADYLDCAKCHIVGNQLPGGSPENWAPNFALAKERLKPEWIIQWLTNPQALLPGTKMPTYFDPDNFDISGPDDILEGDEHWQIRVLRNYLLTLTGSSVEEQNKETETPTIEITFEPIPDDAAP